MTSHIGQKHAKMLLLVQPCFFLYYRTILMILNGPRWKISYVETSNTTISTEIIMLPVMYSLTNSYLRKGHVSMTDLCLPSTYPLPGSTRWLLFFSASAFSSS